MPQAKGTRYHLTEEQQETVINGAMNRAVFETYVETKLAPALAPGDVVILRYVRLYNGQLPQSVLKGRSPIAALKDWQRHRPELFSKRVYNHAGCDI